MNPAVRTDKSAYAAIQHSLMGRLVLATLVVLPLFCGVLGLSLDRAFTSSTLSNVKAQLILQAYSLIASAELEQSGLVLPDHFTEDRLNQASSDLFAMVILTSTNERVWRSRSALNIEVPSSWQPAGISPGAPVFGETGSEQNTLFYLQYDVIWEDRQGQEQSFHFVIFERQNNARKQISAYRQSLWGWLSAIAITMTLLQVAILKWGLKPLQEVACDLEKIQQGKQSQLQGNYPRELIKMTSSINSLLNNEAQQRKRYKETLSNLAHSLKTPLAIMKGSLQPSPKEYTCELNEQINRIDQIVSYQLNRAVSPSLNPFSSTVNLKENCRKVVSALQKVYRDKDVQMVMDIPDDLEFKGEKGDLLELLGNLLDNAFKYGDGEVSISASRVASSRISLMIEDNGKGFTEDSRHKILQRGERADTSQPGQGIGLAVVTDIVSSYQGSIELGRSSSGGASITIILG